MSTTFDIHKEVTTYLATNGLSNCVPGNFASHLAETKGYDRDAVLDALEQGWRDGHFALRSVDGFQFLSPTDPTRTVHPAGAADTHTTGAGA